MTWIDIKTRLPKDRQSVRVKTSINSEISCIFRINGRLYGFYRPPSAKHINDNSVKDVTHWRVIEPEDYEDL